MFLAGQQVPRRDPAAEAAPLERETGRVGRVAILRHMADEDVVRHVGAPPPPRLLMAWARACQRHGNAARLAAALALPSIKTGESRDGIDSLCLRACGR